MPVPKKRTTSTSEATKVESSDHTMPDEQEFRQRMRNLAVSAMRVLIEEVMREELEQCLSAAWGECTPERKGYRNGSYTRDLVTKTGRIEDLSVPRDREGQFHTQVFERYGRYEPELAEALTEMFVSGTSTQKVGKVAQTLMGVAKSASAVSRLNQTLDFRNLRPGENVLCSPTIASFTWMASILPFGMEKKPIRPSS